MPDNNTDVGSQGEEKVVPLHVYIGIKDKLAKREAELAEVRTELGSMQERVATLEKERDTGFVPKSEHEKIQAEYKTLKAAEDARVAKQLSDRKEALIKRGFTAEELKDFTAEQLDLIEKSIAKVAPIAADGGTGKTAPITPKPDVGGGGSTPPAPSAMAKIQSGWAQLHPND